MREPLKDMYNREFLNGFSNIVYEAWDSFDRKGFVATVLYGTWNELTLKGRIRRVTETLGVYLPSRYEEALDVLFSIDETCTGFIYLFFPDFVELYGQSSKNWDISMKALERFTISSSSEFAVRPFFIINPERMTCQMLEWSKNSNENVRRLASEGCRPRLPWREALTMFKHDPTAVISVLENLKEDPSLYVRRSVANNLNDISKDNPDVILEIVKLWKGVNSFTDWILRYGCRTLIRSANLEVMKIFGYGDDIDGPLTTYTDLSVNTPVLKIGESCKLKYEICIRGGGSVHIRIEYGIDFVKARGNTSRKLFFLSDKTVLGGQKITGVRLHLWKNLTTRRHFAGVHNIVLLINGCEVASTTMNLTS